MLPSTLLPPSQKKTNFYVVAIKKYKGGWVHEQEGYPICYRYSVNIAATCF